MNLKAIFLNHGINEELVTHLPEAGLRLGLGGGIERQLKILPHPQAFGFLKTHGIESMQNGLSLRVQHGFFKRDIDGGFVQLDFLSG